MLRTLSTAATGMRAQQQNIDVISNNIANVNTTGYKASRAEFEDLFYQQLREVGGTATPTTKLPTGVQVGTGVSLVAVAKNHTQGPLKETDNDTDLSIQDRGFFQIEGFEGEIVYTRDGSFKLDEQGRMVTSDGFPLIPNITINQQDMISISIGVTGVVEVTTAADPTNPVQVGQIEIARFVNEKGLRSLGDNLYGQTPASGPATLGVPGQQGFGTIRQGFLEQSNVDIVREMVNLITGQRAYEINSNSIRAADDMLQVANNLRR